MTLKEKRKQPEYQNQDGKNCLFPHILEYSLCSIKPFQLESFEF